MVLIEDSWYPWRGVPEGEFISVSSTTRNLQSDNYIGKMTLALQMSHQPPLHSSTLCPETMPTEQPSANDLVSCGGLPSGRKCTDMRRQMLNLVVSYIFHWKTVKWPVSCFWAFIMRPLAQWFQACCKHIRIYCEDLKNTDAQARPHTR